MATHQWKTIQEDSSPVFTSATNLYAYLLYTGQDGTILVGKILASFFLDNGV